LGSDEEMWRQYGVFYKEVVDYIHANYPKIKVGTKITFDGLAGFARAQAKLINDYSDIIMMTYYPIKADFTVREPKEVMSDLKTIVELYPRKKIYILEAGYPSGTLVNSSEAKQAEFIKEIFKAWDLYAEHIKLIDFLWLHDLPPEALSAYGNYYQFDSEKFLAFIGTLGLRSYSAKDKEAFRVLVEEVEARGW